MSKQEFFEKILTGEALSKNEQIEIFRFSTPEAKEILLEYIKHHRLCKEAQMKLFDLQQLKIVMKLLRKYIQRHYLCDEAQVKIFSLPPKCIVNILSNYLSLKRQLCEKAQIELFALPVEVRNDFVRKYIMYDDLSPKAQMKLFDLPPELSKELFLQQDCFAQPCIEAETKALELGFFY